VEKLPTTLGAEAWLMGNCLVDPIYEHLPLNAGDNLDQSMMIDELGT